jgi:hypothetical protein
MTIKSQDNLPWLFENWLYGTARGCRESVAATTLFKRVIARA